MARYKRLKEKYVFIKKTLMVVQNGFEDEDLLAPMELSSQQ